MLCQKLIALHFSDSKLTRERAAMSRDTDGQLSIEYKFVAADIRTYFFQTGAFPLSACAVYLLMSLRPGRNLDTGLIILIIGPV